jgi:hypothetical protein
VAPLCVWSGVTVGGSGVDVGLGRFDGGPELLAGTSLEVARGGGGDVGGGRDGSAEPDAEVVAVALDAGDGGGPDVAGASVGLVWVDGDGAGWECDDASPSRVD